MFRLIETLWYYFSMTRISKKKLGKEVLDKIHNRFTKTIVDLRGKSGSLFIEELFTPTEKIMFAKRLAGLLMIAQSISTYKVSKLLRLSSSTTSKMELDIENGKYPSIAKVIQKKKYHDKFWMELEVFVRMGMPEMGRNRWKWLDEFFPQNK